MADDFSRLVSLACHDLRTPLATVQGFAKTMLRMEELDEDKRVRYLGLIDTSASELAELLDLLSLAARIEGGRYDPVVREADSLALAPDGAGGTGALVRVDPEPVERALASLVRAACPSRGRRRRDLGRRRPDHDRAGDGGCGADRPGRGGQGSRRGGRRPARALARRRGGARRRAPRRDAAELSATAFPAKSTAVQDMSQGQSLGHVLRSGDYIDADGSVCQRPKSFPSVSLQIANQPMLGTGIASLASPPSSLTREAPALMSSTSK